MTVYVGTKLIRAEPMSKSDAFRANLLRTEPGMHIVADEPGYLVEYPDGYRSWSPKATFDSAYRELTAAELSMLHSELGP